MQFSQVHIFTWSLGLSLMQTCVVSDQHAPEMTNHLLKPIMSKAKCCLKSYRQEGKQWDERQAPHQTQVQQTERGLWEGGQDRERREVNNVLSNVILPALCQSL